MLHSESALLGCLAGALLASAQTAEELLNDGKNGLYVLGGKTGYLDEAKWNFVVKVRDSRNKPILVVILGADTKARSFRDAEVAAKWVWDNYRWMPEKK